MLSFLTHAAVAPAINSGPRFSKRCIVSETFPPNERTQALNCIYRALRPGGLLAFWENNPWNPGTRYVMSRIPFDRDAITLSAPQARAMLRTAGFTLLRTEFLFVFPSVLRSLRKLEPRLARLPLGAQYQVLCQKPLVPY